MMINDHRKDVYMKERIIKILGRYTDINEDITESTSIYDLGLNSLDIATFVGDIEEEFDCEIEEEKMPEIEKLGDIIRLLENR